MSVFCSREILLPKKEYDLGRWSVVACDQFTSDPAYWAAVEEKVGDAPSTLRLILPECGMEKVDQAEKSRSIAECMTTYLQKDIFARYPDAMILVRRHQSDGSVREGIVGAVDLESYAYEKGAKPAVRATEETVASRLPARVAMRQNAPLELPHLLLLADDADNTLISPISCRKDELIRLYDFDLMQEGGRIEGYLLDEEAKKNFAAALAVFSDADNFAGKYALSTEEPVMALAVGDGNHSLAAAKQHYENKKAAFGADSKEALACRYVLAELENLHDPALQFSAIHRVVFGVERADLVAAMEDYFADCGMNEEEGQSFEMLFGEESRKICLKQPPHLLSCGSLQGFLDDYMKAHPEAEIDYIHGSSETRSLSAADDAVGFLLPAMPKKDLFPTVLAYGALPRKTFSMGHANEKRYYLEAALIVPEN